MDIFSWADPHNELYFVGNEHGGIFPTPLLTRIRTEFTKSLLENNCDSFVIPNHGLSDFDIFASQTSFHREKHTFNGFIIDDLDKNSWFVYKIVLELNLDNASQLSSIYHNGLIYILNGFSVFSPICLSSVPNYTLHHRGFVINLHFILNPQPFSMVDIQLIQSYFYLTVMGLPKSVLSPYFFIYPLFMRPISSPNFLCSILNPHQVLFGLLNNIKVILSSKYLINSELVYNSNIIPKVLRVDKIDLDHDEITHSSYTSQIIYSTCFESDSLSQLWLKHVDERGLIPHKLRYIYGEFVDKQKMEKRFIHLHKPYVETIKMAIEGFKHTGLFPDLSLGLILILPFIHHVRYHLSLHFLQEYMGVHFRDPLLLQCCLTHSSYKRECPKLGIPQIFLRYSLSKTGYLNNCVLFSPQLYKHPKRTNTCSNLPFNDGDNNEKLEFLGDAVIEFLTTVSLFHIFPDYSGGCLSIFRSAIVQNCHLGYLASQISLGDFILLEIPDQSSYNEFIIRKIYADALESIFGALFLEQSLPTCQKLLGRLLWKDNMPLNIIWNELPQYPVITLSSFLYKDQLPSLFDAFRKLKIFEQSIGLTFSFSILLAKAFTHPSVPFNIYTCGSNSTLEFLGDSVLQFAVTKYLFLNFPQVEGILSNLRSSIVNNKNLGIIGEELNLRSYIILQPDESVNENMLADVFESLIAVIFLDKGIHHVDKFCEILLFNSPELYSETNPKLNLKISYEKYLPSSFISYELLNSQGPSNNSKYTVGVYLGSHCLAMGIGRTRKLAEAHAAKEALNNLNITTKRFHQQK